MMVAAGSAVGHGRQVRRAFLHWRGEVGLPQQLDGDHDATCDQQRAEDGDALGHRFPSGDLHGGHVRVRGVEDQDHHDENGKEDPRRVGIGGHGCLLSRVARLIVVFRHCLHRADVRVLRLVRRLCSIRVLGAVACSRLVLVGQPCGVLVLGALVLGMCAFGVLAGGAGGIDGVGALPRGVGLAVVHGRSRGLVVVRLAVDERGAEQAVLRRGRHRAIALLPQVGEGRPVLLAPDQLPAPPAVDTDPPLAGPGTTAPRRRRCISSG
mmetsp:Transcript_60197/g.174370  ORF Transcript_60197/g.174370 Transcript_60197/m.174370 type:complete len:266 (+) Transcript_60197:740-1537(+)